MYAQDSIELLTKSGIDFKRHEDYGIDVEQFGELLISSGFVLMDDVKWISFHSGYDFGYLLKVLTCSPLPAEESKFFDQLRIYFPCIYDIKYLMKSIKNLKGGLQDIADDLQVARIGPQHQAGSDSLLTATTFFKMRQTFFDDKIDDQKYLGYLYGLGPNVSNLTIGTPTITNNVTITSSASSSSENNGASPVSTTMPLSSTSTASTPNSNSTITNGKINSLSREVITVNSNSSSTNTNTNGTTTPINNN
ncbi:ribonuclease CAF1 [Gigaspora margarita]|nr:ribonuclease CAF1 [Gigaspora margarita]